jgi:hypothetical protein
MRKNPIRPRSPLESQPEYAQAIGLISVETGVMELLLGDLLAALLGTPTRLGQLIYLTPQSYSARLQILKNVAEYFLEEGGKGIKTINGLVKRAKSRIQFRHDTVHSVWGVAVKDRKTVLKRQAPFLERRPAKPVLITELKTDLHHLRVLCDEIIEAIDVIRDSRAKRLAFERKFLEENPPAHTVKVRGQRPSRRK